MNVMGFFLLLLALLILPFLPGLVELKRKLDARPLQVVPDYDVDVHHFSETFREYVHEHFFAGSENGSGAAAEGKLEDGSRYRLLDAGDSMTFEASESEAQVTNRLFIARGRLELPGAMSYLNEIYAHGRIAGAPENIYRALLAEGDIELSDHSILLRWMHAGGVIRVGEGCVLHGRASALQQIILGAGTHFERLQAPRIAFGGASQPSPQTGPRQSLKPEDLAVPVEVSAGRWLVERSVQVPSDSRIDANLVVVGKLTLGDNVQINGSIKSHGRMTLGVNCDIRGGVVAMKEIRVGAFATLKGPVVGEAGVAFDHDCQVGTEAPGTTITAEQIEFSTNCLAHGTVWARSTGRVVPC